MKNRSLLCFIILLVSLSVFNLCDSREEFGNEGTVAAQESYKYADRLLSKPLAGDDGRIYACSGKSFFSFECNGSVAWTVNLNHYCNPAIAPIRDESGKIYFVAENRVLRITFVKIGAVEPVLEILIGSGISTRELDDIIGIAISIMSSSLFISVKNRGLFAYSLQGHPLWSAGPVISRFGYSQGCKENFTGCYFTSGPVVDHCEGSLYISNNEGELYSLSVQSPHFFWIQDFSMVDRLFSITSGNNGRVYLAFPRSALIIALDVSTGNILWRRNVGPLSEHETSLAVDIYGWASIGALDGFLYAFSPNGDLRKALKPTEFDAVQVSPILDCTGSYIFVSQTRMDAKITHAMGEHISVSMTNPVNIRITMLIASTRALSWSGEYPGELSYWLESELGHFAIDESILLALVASKKRDLKCSTIRQILLRTCAQARPEIVNIYAGNERTILLFLFLQFVVLMVLAGSVRFCCVFWAKKEIKNKELGEFLATRLSLHNKRKELSKMISALEERATGEYMEDEVIERIGKMVKERDGIERKLSTSYSLGKDNIMFSASCRSSSLLPSYDCKTRSHSFGCTDQGSVTIFDTFNDPSSAERSYTSRSCSGANGTTDSNEESNCSSGE